MIAWLSANIFTIIVLLVVAGGVFLACRSIWKDRKNGCSCSCGKCPMSGECHSRR